MTTGAAIARLSEPALQEKFDRMVAPLRELGRVLVAYSGGVDSTLVAKVGALALGENSIAVTARSETLTDDEYELTVRIAREHGIRQETIAYSELEIENYAENPINRCYFCKHELYGRLDKLAERFEARAIIDGTNADDVGDYRPGLKAVREFDVVSILRETDAVLQLAHKVRHLGDLHRHCDRLDDAESCYSEALALYREHDGSGSLDYANAVRRMAILKERRGDSVQALALWREARDLYAAVDVASGIEEAERHIARLTPTA